ncbi:MAG: MoaD/ThiS family protein [Desulfobacterales bacterium]|nr:MoaD/ThiS family protein [Desulfobacterales bacterium]
MAVHVQIFGYLSILLHQRQIKLDWHGGTLKEMITHMSDGHDRTVGEELLDENGELDLAYVIFINGESAHDLSTRVGDGDEVVINSMLAGG